MNLYDEFLAYDNDRALPYLQAKKCPVETYGMARNAEISYDEATWTPRLGGEPALLMPVFDCGELLDIIAWIHSAPEKWWLREGRTGILGIEALRHAKVYKQPLVVHATPFQWMMAGGEGCVILKDAAMDDLLDVPYIKANSVLFKKITDHLSLRIPRPA